MVSGLKSAVCKTVAFGYVGSNPTCATLGPLSPTVWDPDCHSGKITVRLRYGPQYGDVAYVGKALALQVSDCRFNSDLLHKNAILAHGR